MNRERQTVLGAVAAAAVLVPLIVGLSLGLPVWLCLLLVLAALSLPVLVGRNLAHKAEQERLQEELQRKLAAPEPAPAPPVEEPSFQRTEISEVALPSAEEDYEFRFGATVWWRHSPHAVGIPHADPSGLACDAILNRAREVTATEGPGRHERARHRLGGSLGTAVRDPSDRVEAFATDVSLALSDVDAERVRKRSALRKDREIWEHERNFERSKREYLGEDVLRSPGSALVWWLTQDNADVERAAELIETFTRLSAAAQDSPVPELFARWTSVSGQLPLVPLPDEVGWEPHRAWELQSGAGWHPPGRNGSRTGEPGRAERNGTANEEPGHGRAGSTETGNNGSGNNGADQDEARPSAAEQFGELVDAVHPAADHAERARLAQRFADLLTQAGHPHAAEDIRRAHPESDRSTSDRVSPFRTPEG